MTTPHIPPADARAFLDAARNGKAPRITPSQVPAYLERMIEVLNRKLPATFTLERQSAQTLTITVELTLPAITAQSHSAP